jgi:pimeloyl-ACP methyl ester carboxylesterase
VEDKTRKNDILSFSQVSAGLQLWWNAPTAFADMQKEWCPTALRQNRPGPANSFKLKRLRSSLEKYKTMVYYLLMYRCTAGLLPHSAKYGRIITGDAMKAKINGAELVFEDMGQGPLVMVLHDRASRGALQDENFTALVAAGYRVILTNLGDLDQKVTKQKHLDAHTRKAVALLNYLGIGRAVIIGISLGGYVLLDLMAKHPERVAAGSFVLTPQTAREIRERLAHPEAQQALREGCVDPLREAFLAATVTAAQQPQPSRLHRVCAWVERMVKGNRAGKAGERLAGMELPMLLVEEGSGQSSAAKKILPARRSRWQQVTSLNSHLVRLLDLLVPGEDDAAEEGLSEGA